MLGGKPQQFSEVEPALQDIARGIQVRPGPGDQAKKFKFSTGCRGSRHNQFLVREENQSYTLAMVAIALGRNDRDHASLLQVAEKFQHIGAANVWRDVEMSQDCGINFIDGPWLLQRIPDMRA